MEYITLRKMVPTIGLSIFMREEVGISLVQHLETLKEMKEFWEYAGFSFWQNNGMAGVYRRVTFVKDGMLGKVAEFYSDDYILWTHRESVDEEMIMKHWKAEADVMKHRFLLLSAESGRTPRSKSIWLGFGGFVEVMRYRIGAPVPAKFKDLVFLVDKGLEYAEKGVGVAAGTTEGGDAAFG